MDYSMLREGLLRPRRTRPLGSSVDLPDDPRRAFLHAIRCSRCGGAGRTGAYDSDHEWEDYAWSCHDCRSTGAARDSPIDAVAGDEHHRSLGTAPEAAVQAESLAWETAAALLSWGIPEPSRLVWRVGIPFAHRLGAVLEGLPEEVDSPLRLLFTQWDLAEVGDHIDIAGPHGYRQPYVNVLEQARRHAAWEAASDRGLRFPETTIRHAIGQRDFTDHPLAGRSFADLSNPLTPLLRIWLTGFALDLITDGTITMYAAPFDDGEI